MKKKLIITLLSTVVSGSVIAAPTIENTVSVDASTGYKHVKSANYEDLGFGLGVKNDLLLDNSHHFTTGIDGYKTGKDSYGFDNTVGRAKGKEFELKANYKYDIPVNYDLTVSPLVGVGYTENHMKFDGQKNNLSRSYAEIGAEANYMINQEWALSPSLVYQRDFASKEKFNGYGLKDPSWGQKVGAEFGVSKRIGNSNVKVSPYYSRYTNNTSDILNKIEDAGVKIKYSY